ncbi:MAG: ATP-dependent Clp protease proteolytic subunit [bacterium]|nr:ATP-dependent Clp protease proteolytic subunit [bacterium]
MEKSFINFNLGIDNNSAQALFRVLQDQLSNNVEEINLLISSPGGSVDAGIGIYNFLKGLPVIVNTHNYGSCDSIAALIFCAGEKRITVSNSRFLLHGIGIDVKNLRLDENKLEEMFGSIKNQRKIMSQIIAQECNKSIEDVEKDMLKGIILTSQEGINYGIATEIQDELVPSGTNFINVSFN